MHRTHTDKERERDSEQLPPKAFDNSPIGRKKLQNLHFFGDT